MRSCWMPGKLMLLAVWLLAGLMTGRVLGAPGMGGEGPVSARAVVSGRPLVRGGTARVVVAVTVAPPYHIQSATPHDKYLIPTSLAVTAPAGVTAGAARFPVAQEIPTPGGISNEATLAVYEGTFYIEVPVKVAADAPVGEGTIGLVLTSQACTTTCLPPKKERLQVPIEIAASGGAGALSAADAAVLKAADAQHFAAPAVPTVAPASAPATAAVVSAGEGGPKLLSDAEQVALIQSRPYKQFNQVDDYPLWAIVLFALLAGAILNVMPCVLPVIPLKVLSLVQQAHGDRRLAIAHALVFSAGIISLFVALAIVLKGSHLFYGQQFQSPAFLIVMALVVVALGLSMLGVWTINPPRAVYAVDTATVGSGGHGFAGSYMNGLLATLLATPCSAPYLGPVLAWAFTQPTWVTSLSLALVGVGMSLPYVILAAFPVGLNKLPRAGRWSELLKQGLGIVMLGVALYLVTLVPNVTMWPWVLFGAVVLSLVCWGWGQIPTVSMGVSRVWGIRAAVVVIGAAMGLGVYALSTRAVLAEAPALRADGEWQPFNVALLDAALKEGRPVVVDWTASWCINCRSLDALVLSTDVVRKGFAESHALLLRADLSSDNPPATALNEKLGGEAIPVLAIFAPGRPFEPVVLRDAYTRERVLKEMAAAR